MSGYQLNFAKIFCEHLPRCHRFYAQQLLLPTLDYRPAKGYALYNTGPCVLILEAISDPAHRNRVGRYTGLSLSIHDLEAKMNQLTANGIHLSRDIRTEFWGGKTAEIQDPDGNTIIFAEPAPTV